MNYITHLNEVLDRFSKDARLNPKHVSLYMALFWQWNRERFPTWIYISRKVIMNSSRIGSTSTYHRAIKDLNDWKYVTYRPSYLHNPSSRVKLLRRVSKGVPLEVLLSPKSSSLMGRPHPIGKQPTIYNKHINFKKDFKKEKKAIKKLFESSENGSKSYTRFLIWLKENYTYEQLIQTNWQELKITWENQLQKDKTQRTPVHFKDNLKIQKVKRYDEPL